MTTSRLVLALAALASVVAHPAVREFIVSGACADKDYLNGLVLRRSGRTKSGSPWFKANGQDFFLYHDQDCSGGGDGSARWIIDSDAPLTDRMQDLDDDGSCQYEARLDSNQVGHPPLTGFWRMKCDGAWKDIFLTLAEITTTSTSTSSTTLTTTSVTTTTETITSTTNTATTTTATATATTKTATATTTQTASLATSSAPVSSTASGTASASTSPASTASRTTTTVMNTPEAPTGLPKMHLTLAGACGFKGQLNGEAFVERGTTRSVAGNSSYFESAPGGLFLYYDADCAGDGSKPGRWVVDEDAPSTEHLSDLDRDGKCSYHASVVTANAKKPPVDALWRMFCGKAWEERSLRFTSTYGRPPPAEASDELRMQGLCSAKAWMNGMVLKKKGLTSHDAPFYHGRVGDADVYLYHDRSCNKGDAAERWILDDNLDMVRAKEQSRDLDDDGGCDYHARVESEQSIRPPASALWHMQCGDGWKNLPLTLQDVRVGQEPGEAEVDAAGGVSWSLLPLLLAAGIAAG